MCLNCVYLLLVVHCFAGDQMKLNEHTRIFGSKTVLVPYQRKHVPRLSSVVIIYSTFCNSSKLIY